MFYIIGIGLTTRQLTLEAIEAIKKCENIYVDNYTNKFSCGELKEIEKTIQKKITVLNRKELEQSLNFLKDNNCLLVIGNPFSATTHYALIEEAKEKKINVKTIAGISIFNYRGCCGLFEYKFGKTTSIVYALENYKPTSFYDVIIENQKIGAHTLCLLDIKIDENKLMTIAEACEILKKIDDEKEKALAESVCVAICGAGGENEKIICFDFKDLKKMCLESFPQSLIICGKLNDFEKRAVDEYRC